MTIAVRSVLVAVIAALTVLASSLTLAAGTTSTASAATVSQIRSMDPATYEKQVQAWVNKVRSNHGRRTLRLHPCTDKYSERWSRHLASTLRFHHQDLSPFFDDCGARYAGENLARGVVTPRRVVQLWMSSDAHRRVMLSPSPRRIGVAAVQDSRGDWVVTANFTRL